MGLKQGLRCSGPQQGEAQARKLLFWPKAGCARCGPQGPGLGGGQRGRAQPLSRLGAPHGSSRGRGPGSHCEASERLGLCPLTRRGWSEAQGKGPCAGAAAWERGIIALKC